MEEVGSGEKRKATKTFAEAAKKGTGGFTYTPDQ